MNALQKTITLLILVVTLFFGVQVSIPHTSQDKIHSISTLSQISVSVSPQEAYAQYEYIGGIFNPANYLLGNTEKRVVNSGLMWVGNKTVEVGSGINSAQKAASCISGPVDCALDILDTVVRGLANLILWLTSWVTWFAGVSLNMAIYLTIFEMHTYVENMDAIENGWTIFRDIANIAFIFMLLYIAIATILEIGINTQKTLVRLIIAALLINFSLFFTTAIIDTSNILTVTIYDQIGESVDTSTEQSLANWMDNGLSGRMMDGLNLQSVYNVQQTGNIVTTGLANINTFLLQTLGGSLLLLVAAAIFFAGAMMFVIRFVIFIFLMITSPIAFATMILPNTQKTSKKWWSALMDQAIWAPVFMLMTLIALEVIQSANNAIDLSNSDANVATNALIGSGISAITLFIGFVFLVGILVISKMAGASGADWSTRAGGRVVFGAAGFAGRQTLGRAGAFVADSERLKNAASDENRSAITRGAARLALRTGSGTSKASFDARNRAGSAAGGVSQALGGGKVNLGKSTKTSFAKRQEETEKQAAERAKLFDPSQNEIAGAEANKKLAEDAYEQALHQVDPERRNTIQALRKTTKEQRQQINALPKGSPERIALQRDLQQKEAELEQTETAFSEDISKPDAQEQLKPFQEEVRQANLRADKLKGVNSEEAKKRAQANTKRGNLSKEEYNKKIEQVAKDYETKSAGEERKESYAKQYENSSRATKLFTLRSQRQQDKIAGKIRKEIKGKKSTKDLVKEFAKAEDIDIPDDNANTPGDTQGTSAPEPEPNTNNDTNSTT